jgi:hypothetical protein
MHTNKQKLIKKRNFLKMFKQYIYRNKTKMFILN